MNAAKKKKWVEALRSGKYTQTRRALRRIDDTYCCLGVLCNVKGVDWTLGPYEEFYCTAPDKRFWGVLPPDVLIWAELGVDGEVYIPLSRLLGIKEKLSKDAQHILAKEEMEYGIGAKSSLAQLNDRGVSFADIATIIEELL